MNWLDLVTTLIEENKGVLRTSDALKAGVSKPTLANLVRNGHLERIAHGQYVLAAEFPDELYIWQQRISKMIYSHKTALFLHDISERTPFQQSVTIPSNTKLPKTFRAGYKVYYVKPELFDLGVTHLPSKMGHQVEAYNLERTICDVLRSRNRIDDQILLATMKQYSVMPNKDLGRLREYAEAFRVMKVLRMYLEVLL